MGFDLTIQTWPIFARSDDRIEKLVQILQSIDSERFLAITMDFIESDAASVASAICDLGQDPDVVKDRTSTGIPLCDEAGRLFFVRIFILADGGLLGDSNESDGYYSAEIIDRLSDICEIRELCQAWSIADHAHLRALTGYANV